METLKLKNTAVKIKYLLKGLNSTFELAEEIVNLKIELLFKDEGKIKTFPDKQKQRICC